MSNQQAIEQSAMSKITLKIPFLPELVLIVIGIAAFFAFPTSLGFLTEVVIMILFVLSLDLLLGYTGIATLGQSAMFGMGAYAAGLFSMHVYSDPIVGLLVAGVMGALIALASGLLILRAHGFSFIVLTIAVAQLLHAGVNQASDFTGGDDGLYGYTVAPLFGVFEFDFYGRLGFLYSLGVLVICYYALRRLVNSPFGLAAEGLREDRERMKALGYPVYRHLVVVYVIAGLLAGLAGGLSAQTVQVVGMQSLSFTLSAEALVMLILGGTRRLYGAVVGTVIFMTIHHYAAALDPSTWMLFIGLLLVFTVFVLPRGLTQLVDIVRQRIGSTKGGQ